MADILIRGMEMPPTGNYFAMAENEPNHAPNVTIWKRKADGDLESFGFGEIVELPEHGDLIDRDALKHKFCTHCDGYEYDTGACVDGDQDCMDAKIIMTAPVIVPSNKEETE